MISLTLRLVTAFLLALILTIVPIPEILAGARPPWVLLLALYLQFYLPAHFKIIILCALGLILDVLLSTVIGEHMLALSLVAWLASNKARRFCFFPMGQQMILIGFFCLLYQLTIATIDAFLGFHVSFINIIWSTVISILVWPWLQLIIKEMLSAKMSS